MTSFLLFLLYALCLVHITQSHTMESMSFTYQHSSTSVSIATKPSSSRMLLDSDSDSEEEPLSCSHSPTEVDSTGDIPENCLVLFLLCHFLCFRTNTINT